MSQARKKLLLVLRRAPYGSGLARAALDLVLAAAAFDQDIDVLFMDDGAWQLLPGQDAAAIGSKSIEATLASLTLYGVETLYVESASLERRGIDPAALGNGVECLDAAALPAFVDAHDQVIGF